MQIVVTGATGFIGPKVVRALLDRGDAVTVITRDVETARGRTDGRAALAPWAGVDEIVQRADAVVHLAGAPIADARWTRERVALLRSSRVEPTQRVARAVAQSPKRPVLVSASAVGIYGMRHDDVLLDEGSPHGDDVLAEIAEAWETATTEARNAGARVANARIGIVLGRDGGVLAKMITPFKLFVGGPVGDGSQWVSWIHWRDAVRALLFAIDDARLDGPFNVCAPSPVTMRELGRAIGETLHRPSAFAVPAFALRLALGDGLAKVVLSGQRAFPKRLEALGFVFEHTDIRGALSEIL